MADLEGIRVENFRAFREGSFAVPKSGLVLVTGPNNAGKSALLSAFDVLAGQVQPAAVLHASSETSNIWFRFKLNEEERLALIGNINTASWLAKGAADWIEWQYSYLQGSFVPVIVRVAWPDADGLIVTKAELIENQWRTSALRAELSNWDPSSYQVVLQGGPVTGILEQFTNIPYLVAASSIISNWRSGYFHFQPLKQTAGRATNLAGIVPALQTDGANLPAVLLYMKTNTPATWNQLVGLMKDIVPGVGTLEVPASGSQFEVVFMDDNIDGYRHNLKDLGTGVEQILMTLVVGLTQTARTVVLEEPETGLHPTAQRALLGLLQDWSKNRLFVASTHSAAMLDWSSPGTSVLAVSRANGESTVTTVTNERASVLRSLGVRLSDVLSAERILILEGSTDRDVLDVWFPHVTRNPLVAILAGDGGYNARHTDLLAGWLDKADELAQRRILYIRDRDELSADFLKKLDASKSVYVLPCRELENLLLDFDALAEIINVELAARGRTKVSVDALAESVRESADGIKHVVVLKRVMAEFADPVRLVDHKMRQWLSKKPADAMKAALVTEMQNRIPDGLELASRVEQLWKTYTADVERDWNKDWQQLVPGADLLKALFLKYLGRGYDKSTDGIAVARAMTAPPDVLKQVLGEFMVDRS